MRRVWILAARDLRATVLTRTFLLAVFGLPVLALGVSALAGGWLATQNAQAVAGRVLVLGEVGAVEALRAEQLRATGRRALALEVERAADEPAALAALAHGEALAVLRPGPDGVALWVQAKVPSAAVGDLERWAARGAVRARLAATGETLEPLEARLAPPPVSTFAVSREGRAEALDLAARLRRELVPAGFMLLLWLGSFVAAQQLLFSMIEERSNKLIEVLLSAASPLELMAGKILGYGAVGLLILGVYGGAGLAALLAFAPPGLVTAGQLAWGGVFFLLAYFTVAPIMAAVGSVVRSVQEANTLLVPVVGLLMLPLLLWLPLSRAPDGALATALSFTPPVMPFVLALRVGSAAGVPGWQLWLAVVWGSVCVVLLVWLAARVFRVGMLAEGQAPSLRTLWRWALRG